MREEPDYDLKLRGSTVGASLATPASAGRTGATFHRHRGDFRSHRETLPQPPGKDTRIIAQNPTAIGENSTSTKGFSTAIAENSTNHEKNATAPGENSTDMAEFSTVIEENPAAIEENATGIGENEVTRSRSGGIPAAAPVPACVTPVCNQSLVISH
ncbi:MAG: hypothetical protein LBK99_08135 [Opitutaceae bacterium]|jgi:hypothetical protein|nr:hypothetical protein [Opitutaceae bacterium]